MVTFYLLYKQVARVSGETMVIRESQEYIRHGGKNELLLFHIAVDC